MGEKLFIFTLTALILSMIPAASLTHASAALASYDSATLVLSPDSGPVGTEVHVSGSGLVANRSYSLVWDPMAGDPPALPHLDLLLASGLTDSSGGFSASFEVPAGVDPGKYMVATFGADSCNEPPNHCPPGVFPSLAATFTVTPQSIQSNINISNPAAASDPGSASGQTLPSTGLNAAFLLYLLSFCFVALLVLWHPKAKN